MTQNESRITSGQAGSSKPNFVFILIDDWGWTDLACYGSSFYETPSMDKLAREGIRFTDAYATCPVCSPTRASILTGKYPPTLQFTDWIPGFSPKPHHKMLPAPTLKNLPLEEITIAETLKPAGYVSASIGKWHLGARPYYPEHQGFDLNIGGTESGMPTSHFFPRWNNNPPIEGRDGEYLTDRLTLEAENFIEKNKERPFFLYLSHYAVHIPIEAKAEMISKYQAKSKAGDLQSNSVYAAMIESVDESVGRILKKLRDTGLEDRTVVILTSDNGGLYTEEPIHGMAMSNHPLRAGKGYLYEGGIRVPLIIRMPQILSGSVCSTPVSSVDFFPTILELAGMYDEGRHDGESLSPLLRGEDRLKREAIFWHYPHYCIQENPAPMMSNTGIIGGRPGGVIRRGDYKLIEFYEDMRVELYNLREDIGERNNLAESKPKLADELRELLSEWRKNCGALMPEPNPNYTGELTDTDDRHLIA